MSEREPRAPPTVDRFAHARSTTGQYWVFVRYTGHSAVLCATDERCALMSAAVLCVQPTKNTFEFSTAYYSGVITILDIQNTMHQCCILNSAFSLAAHLVTPRMRREL